jgi:hypothetical protein
VLRHNGVPPDSDPAAYSLPTVTEAFPVKGLSRWVRLDRHPHQRRTTAFGAE